MRVLFCGSRTWDDELKITQAFVRYHPEVVIHGDAQGADRLAGAEARRRGIPIEAYPADWEKHGRAAGPIRNQQMLDEGKPDLVVAFHLYNSRGTADMIRRARSAGIPVEVIA